MEQFEKKNPILESIPEYSGWVLLEHIENGGEGVIRTLGRLLDLRLVSSEFLSTTQAPLQLTPQIISYNLVDKERDLL